jgi:GT2 family glycosyltransferase
MAIDLSIIIVNYRSADYVFNCIKCIEAQTQKIQYEVIVVDNASYDECRQNISIFENTKYMQSDVNLGFGKANNLGASVARGTVLLFLNPDTEIREHALDRLYEEFQKLKEPGAVGCRLLNEDGTLQTSCVQAFPTIVNQTLDSEIFQRVFPNSPLWGNAVLHENLCEPASVEVVSGACIMIGRKTFDKVGGFSPDYFMYAEDLDLCYKVKQTGFTNYFVGGVSVIHYGGGSTKSVSNFASIMIRQSVHTYFRKYKGGVYGVLYKVAMFCNAIVRIILIAVLRCRKKSIRLTNSFDKWITILRWTLGFSKGALNNYKAWKF